jgi:CHC2 zinc finger
MEVCMRVDFQELKSKIGIGQVLTWLGIELKQAGQHQLRGPCPIHNGSNDRQFVVSTDKNLWHCFGDCHGGGDVIELVSRMKQVTQKQAAEMIAAHFGMMATPAIKKLEPIDYLDPAHETIHALGITKETCEHFKADYKNKGIMSGRLAIPIYQRGELLAYCGRSVKREQEPMLAFPKDFKPDSVIFNADNVTGPTIHVTDDPLRVLVAHQHGVTNVVALLALTANSFALLSKFMIEIKVDTAEWL